MSNKKRVAGIAIGAIAVIAGVTLVFVLPHNRTPGVRLGRVETPAPDDWRTVNDETLMQLKTGGFPPFVVNIWYIGTEDGVITATRPDGGFWGNQTRANPNARIRIGDAAYDVTAREVLEPQERSEMLASYVDKYNLHDVPGMTLADLADPALPWEVFFWTAR